jgi:uncharacterized protein involved in exopolysaccharide biosynthesis
MTTSDSVLDKLAYIWQNRRVAFLFACVLFLFFFMIVLTIPAKYVVSTTIFPKDNSRLGGGSSLLLGAVGLNPLQSAIVSRFEILLQSEEIGERAVVKGELLTALYPRQWNPSSKTWRDGKAPTNRMGGRALLQMVKLEPNSKGFITISLESRDPRFAATALSALLHALEERVQQDAQTDLKNSLAFLDRQLAETTDPLLRDKILALMATHIEGAVYASAKSFDVSETPRPPLKPNSPRRGVLTILALLGSLITTFFALLAIRSAREIRMAWKAAGDP